jgi:hypothetical protein
MATTQPRSKGKKMSILPPINEINKESNNNNNITTGKRNYRGLWMTLIVVSAGSALVYQTDPQRRRLTDITRPLLRSMPRHSLLMDDGTLFSLQGDDEPLCDYFTKGRRLYTDIRRLHLHYPTCQDSPERLDDYFQALLLSSVAEMPFTMTCGVGGSSSSSSSRSSRTSEDSLLRRLIVEKMSPRQLTRDESGTIWTPEKICKAGNTSLNLVKDIIIQSLIEIVPTTTVDDLVIQFDPTVPISAYEELISEAQFERGTIESLAIVGTGPHLLVQHLERTFPDISIRILDEEGNLLDLYSRLMHANIAGVCSTPSICSYAIMSGVGGFLYDLNCPSWVSKASKKSGSKVQLFKVRNSRTS